MKIRINKEYTTIAQAPKVKADLAEFKARYTDGDLLNAFRDAADFWGCLAGDITSCTVEGMPAGTDFIKNGDDPNTAWEKASGSYGRVQDAVKFIDPRKE